MKFKSHQLIMQVCIFRFMSCNTAKHSYRNIEYFKFTGHFEIVYKLIGISPSPIRYSVVSDIGRRTIPPV